MNLPDKPIIYLDKSVDNIIDFRLKYKIEINQFKTPLTGYKNKDIKFILDNGAYSGYPSDKFYDYVEKYIKEPFCQYIVIPDEPFDHKKTVLMFDEFLDCVSIPKNKRAFVAQNGSTYENIPFDEFECLFIGGDNSFKDHTALKIAENLDYKKWVHVGRLNTPSRLTKWFNLCHSFDGSGISRFGSMLEKIISTHKNLSRYNQKTLGDYI